jgi:hypothetical protein
MTTSPVRHERRAAQRFEYQIPVCVKVVGSEPEFHGLTQDLSARGTFFYTEATIDEGSALELTLLMPSEITLAESMRVRCRGRVLRVVRQNDSNKMGVAVQLEGYEFLPNSAHEAAEGAYARISSLHNHLLAGEEDLTRRSRPLR